MQGLRVGVLGPLVVRRDGAAVALNSVMLRTLLGLLAIQPHRLVTRDEIIDTLWGDNPPPTCVTSVHVHIGRLRTLAEPGRARRSQGLISIVGHRGYVLQPEPGQLDLLDFLALADEAATTGTGYPTPSGEAEPSDWVVRTAKILAEALRCWRGRPLAGIGGRLTERPAVAALSERRTTMAIAYADAALRLITDRHAAAAGHREQALGLVRELAHEQPLHEGVHARLMRLLAATGQQAAALSLYAELRTRLDEELGVEPGHDLAEAHLQVLRHEVTDGHAERPATGPGSVAVRPAQLPLDVQPFTGRTQALSQLDPRLSAPLPSR